MSRSNLIGCTLLVALAANALHLYRNSKDLYSFLIRVLDDQTVSTIATCISLYVVYKLYVNLRNHLFGKVQNHEEQTVSENSWIFFTDVVLQLTMFREDMILSTLVLFFVVFHVKCIHWILRDRIDQMHDGENVQRFMIRRSLFVALFIDLVLSTLHTLYALSRPSIHILFSFEYFGLILNIARLFVHYATTRLRDPELHKRIQFFSDFVYFGMRLLVDAVFFMWIIINYNVPLYVVKNIISTMKELVRRVTEFVVYNQLKSNLDRLFSSATETELINAGSVCLVCQDEMRDGKVLPCSHVFHSSCLRDWLEQQRACPICRFELDINTRRDQKTTVINYGGERVEAIPIEIVN